MRRQRHDRPPPSLASRSPTPRAKRARQHRSVQEEEDSVARAASNQSRQDQPFTHGGQRAPSRAPPLVNENHNRPARTGTAPSQGRQNQGPRYSLPPGGETSPSEDQQPQLLDHVSSPQGSHRAPSVGNRRDVLESSTQTFPKCAHKISGALLCDFLSSESTECPRCQLESVEGTLHFEPCGHAISGDDLRDFHSRGSMQPPIFCSVCNRSSSWDFETGATARPTGKATSFNQRSRITVPDYEDPRLIEGVSSDIIVSQSGRPRFHVGPSVWKRMSTKDRKEFHYRCNIYFGLRPGGEVRQPKSRGNHNQANTTPAKPNSSDPGEVETIVSRVQLRLPQEVHDKLANGNSVTGTKKQTPVQSPAPPYNRMTASAPRQTSWVGTENPANEFLANPTNHSSAADIASGSAVWDNRLLLEWLASPDWKPAPPRACIYMFCGIKSTDADDLNAHILCDHYGAPPTGTIIDARGDFLNAVALESYFGGNIPPSAQVYIGRWFPHDDPQSHRDKGSSRTD